MWHHDQPFGDSSALPTFLLSELTRQHVTVALCGDGGDELFGGYERFAAAVALDRFDRLPSGLRRAVVRGVEGIPPRALGGRGASAQRALSRAGMGLPDAYPFVLSTPAIDKLRFVHEVVTEAKQSRSEKAGLLRRVGILGLLGS